MSRRKYGLIGWVLSLALLGCRPAGTSVLGVAPNGQGQPIAEVLRQEGGAVTVAGEMIEKCPVAGCWFILRDATGTLKVDTKTAGFVVVDVPLHSQLVVTGRLTRRGTELELDAAGARY